MRKSIYLFALAAISFTACNGNAKKENLQEDNQQHDHSQMEPTAGNAGEPSQVAEEKQESVSAILNHYLTMKDALVEDDSEKAASSGKLLFDAFAAFEASAVSDPQQELGEIIEDAKMHAEHINENAANIVHQREHFEILSIDIKDLLAVAGTDRVLYQQYCPMYNDNKGGMWLSASNEVKNPFFGSKMLGCGEVQETIPVE